MVSTWLGYYHFYGILNLLKNSSNHLGVVFVYNSGLPGIKQGVRLRNKVECSPKNKTNILNKTKN